MSWKELVLTVAAFLGLGMAGLGHATGSRCQTGAGLLLTGVALASLMVIVQQSLPGRARKPLKEDEAWVYWIFFVTIILLALIGLLSRGFC